MEFAVTVLGSMMLISHSKKQTILNNRFYTRTLFYLMFVAVTINVVFRDLNFVDTRSYVGVFRDMQTLSLAQSLDFYKGERLFNTITWIIAQATANERIYLLCIWLLFALPFVFAIKKLFEGPQVLVLLFSHFNYPFFYNYAQNVIRQGMAIALLLVAVAYLVTDKKSRWFYVCILAAPFLHWSALPMSALLLLLRHVKIKLGLVLALWSAAVLAFITGINTNLLRPVYYLIPNIDSYTRESTLLAYGGGTNRLDFLLFSAFWVAFALIANHFFLKRDELYERLIKIYVMFNTVFLIIGFVAYSDRIAGYSWMIVPALVWYPVFHKSKYNTAIVYLLLVVVFGCGVLTEVYKYYNPFHPFQ